jgi:DNA-binding response OmpR family regulator
MGTRILIVDDDEEICQEIGSLLRDEGFQVTVVFDGVSALKLLDTKVFDLLILDLKVPGIPGLEILRHVKAKRSAAKVLVVSGKPVKDMYGPDSDESIFPDDSDQAELFDKADGFVSKPFDVEILLARIKTLV